MLTLYLHNECLHSTQQFASAPRGSDLNHWVDQKLYDDEYMYYFLNTWHIPDDGFDKSQNISQYGVRYDTSKHGLDWFLLPPIKKKKDFVRSRKYYITSTSFLMQETRQLTQRSNRSKGKGKKIKFTL
jgi:hypothetical protein